MATNPIPPVAGACAPATNTQQKTDRRVVDLSTIPSVGWALLDEHQTTAVCARSVKSLRNDRYTGVGIKFRKLNGTTVRYRLSDIREWLDAQPTFDGTATATFGHLPIRITSSSSA
jgi:hypothetical protein